MIRDRSYRLFAFAGTDTTSNALSRIIALLTEHQDVQDKVRDELNEAGPDGQDIPYDTLVDLPYLDAVCRETLRVYVSSDHSPSTDTHCTVIVIRL